MIIGLTGGSGTGKSTVVNFFVEQGFMVLDFDKISRDICQIGMPCLKELVLNFGNKILFKDGSLNRKYLGNIVFNDKEKLLLLNTITHKYITKEMYNFLSINKDKNIVFDAPLLFEAGIHNLCDKTIAILAPEETRIERIMKRDRLTKEQAIVRIRSQKDDSYYIDKANIVIYNASTKENLYNALKDIFYNE